MGKGIDAEYETGKAGMIAGEIRMHTQFWTKSGLLFMIMGLACTLILNSASAQEFFNQKEKYKYYKWIDKKGAVHYTQTPPPRGEAVDVQRIKAHGADASNRESANETLQQRRSQLLNDAEERIKAKDDQKAEKEKSKVAEKRKENCDTAKANMNRLQGDGRIRIKNDKGEFEYLDDQSRQSQINLNNKYIKENCGN